MVSSFDDERSAIQNFYWLMEKDQHNFSFLKLSENKFLRRILVWGISIGCYFDEPFGLRVNANFLKEEERRGRETRDTYVISRLKLNNRIILIFFLFLVSYFNNSLF